MKKYLISIGIFIGLILIFSLFINLFYYFDLINNTVYKITLILTISIITFISSYILGTKTKQKAYLEGLKYSLIIISVMFILSLVFKTLSLKSIIYYLIIMIISIIGITIGKSKRANS